MVKLFAGDIHSAKTAHENSFLNDEVEGGGGLLVQQSLTPHARDRNIDGILEALARALGSADQDSIRYYTELLEIGLGDTPAGAIWKELTMIGTFFPGRGTMIEKAFLEGEAKGEAKGKAQLITRVLRGRGIAVSPQTEQRIMECQDLDVLDAWFDRALTATRAEDLFTVD